MEDKDVLEHLAKQNTMGLAYFKGAVESLMIKEESKTK